MKSIRAKTTSKLVILYLVTGVCVSLSAIGLFLYDESSTLANLWFPIVLGLLYIGQGIYNYCYGYTLINWDNDRIELKSAGRKMVVFKTEAIKNLTLTKQHFILNAGLGDGKMIDLEYFSESDREKLKADFGHYDLNTELT